jgi:hypothetical protein
LRGLTPVALRVITLAKEVCPQDADLGRDGVMAGDVVRDLGMKRGDLLEDGALGDRRESRGGERE